jgi:hypothetical protein
MFQALSSPPPFPPPLSSLPFIFFYLFTYLFDVMVLGFELRVLHLLDRIFTN